MAISVIEARMVLLGIPVILLLAVLWILYWRRSKQRLGVFVVERPFTGFVAVMVISCLLFFLVWGLIFGGFPQPSEMGI